MSDLNVKVGLIGKFDMLKFKNMSKVREKAIQAAPAKEISGVFPVNENAKALHPDFLELEIIVPESAGLADSGKETAFRRLEALLGALEYQMSGTVTRSYLSMLQKH